MSREKKGIFLPFSHPFTVTIVVAPQGRRRFRPSQSPLVRAVTSILYLSSTLQAGEQDAACRKRAKCDGLTSRNARTGTLRPGRVPRYDCRRPRICKPESPADVVSARCVTGAFRLTARALLFGEMSQGPVQTALHPPGRHFAMESDRIWTSCSQKRLKYSVKEGCVCRLIPA